MTPLKQCALAAGIAGAMAIATNSSFAAPVMSGAGVFKAVPNQATEIQYRGVKPGGGGVVRGGVPRGGFAGRGFAGRGFAGNGFAGRGFAGRGFAHGGYGHGGWGRGRVAAGVAAGVIAGAAAANAYGPGYYYGDPGYVQPDAYYDPGYADAPVGYGAPYGGDDGQCVTDDGYGRMVPCR